MSSGQGAKEVIRFTVLHHINNEIMEREKVIIPWSSIVGSKESGPRGPAFDRPP